ncbi:tetratricopeptide repeat protein [Campylobacter sp. JMF_08 NE1]|uniref:tetratricopeptide repeat protein n=1 Tax=Campylobacter sp. JMF_08 NE1 TaxID=2983821 RepID=UPI0022EA03A6|nr:tetratricopeptide repeat protein [Campylobacter sp. JMF_08 NE1]MDA3047490.1 sel1 repeat family protein [Campylobacter sp. JMF_08 NE1]
MKKILLLIFVVVGLFGDDNDYTPEKIKDLKYFCSRDFMSSCVNLGYAYDNGLGGLERDIFKAKDLYTKACDGDNATACYNLAILYSKGEGVRQDKFKAKELYEKACDKNEYDACNNLGILYERGEGVKQGFCTANDLFLKACSGGNAVACVNLGNNFLVNNRCEKYDIQKAKEHYGKACDLGSQKGCDNYKDLNTLGYLRKK